MAAIAMLLLPGAAAGEELRLGGGALRLSAKPDGRPKIAIVVDDLGLDHTRFDRANALPVPVTLGVLPYGENAQGMADRAAPGNEVILHLPMEPTVRQRDAGPDAVSRGPVEEIRAQLARNLGKLSGYRGVNNHTGSALTADGKAMRVVLADLAERDLYFLDSRTTAKSKARAVAGAAVVIESDLFIDDDFGSGGTEAVTRRLAQLEAIAGERGYAIGIGHPYATTFEALESWAAEAETRVQFVTLSVIAGEERARRHSAGY